MAGQDPFITDIARHIWETKYRWRVEGEPRDADMGDTWRRVARALASVEEQPAAWEGTFFDALDGFRFIPAGRILAGAGTERRVTLFNCFVMGLIDDSMDGIFDALKEGALTMQQGGGVGYDFSTLRPRGTPARTTGTVASGPVSFMRIWDAACATLLSTGARRGAMMATLRCDHPDVEEFIRAKQTRGALVHFNLSVQASDAFMAAVHADDDWPLVFPEDDLDDVAESDDHVLRHWPGKTQPVRCRVVRRVRARQLWDRIMRSTYDYSEPGILFVDRINSQNNLWYREHLSATNPCGEIPLPPYGACDLGSINLTRFVTDPFTDQARLDLEAIEALVPTAVRMMDNVVDLSRFPLDQQARTERGNRRIGLGMTGLGDSLIMLGLHYDSEPARQLAAEAMRRISHAAYRASIELAREKGAFPLFEPEAYGQGAFIASLPEDIREAIGRHGIRNSHLTAIAPTGTISLLANNVSSGIEPAFDFAFQRQVLELDGTYRRYAVEDYALIQWRRLNGDQPRPETFVSALELPPRAHLAMQAVLQPYVDNSISKTINIPEDFDYEAFRGIYEQAFDHRLKGCTTYRPSAVRGAVLEQGTVEQASHCCTPEREAD